MSLSPFSLATPNAASRLSTKVKVVELCRKPKVLNYPQAAGLGPPSFAHGPLYAVFPRSSTDNVLVIGKLVPSFFGLYIFTIWKVMEVESAQRQGRSENISRLPPPPQSTSRSRACHPPRYDHHLHRLEIFRRHLERPAHSDPLNEAVKTVRTLRAASSLWPFPASTVGLASIFICSTWSL